MSSITDGLLMLDPDWRFTYCNEQGARLLGTQVPSSCWAAASGSCFRTLLGTAVRSGFRQAVGHAADGRRSRPSSRSRSTRWLECHCYPSDEGLSVYFHDITDRREVEIAARAAARRRTGGARRKRTCRARQGRIPRLAEPRTAHAAGGHLRLGAHPASSPASTPSMLRRGIEAIARNARAQAQLVDDLLDMSRIVSGKLRMNVERVDLTRVAAAAADSGAAGLRSQGRDDRAALLAGARWTMSWATRRGCTRWCRTC